MSKRLALTLVLLLGVIAAVACTRSGSEEAGPLEAALGLVPESEVTRAETRVVDLVRARRGLPAASERGLAPFADIVLRMAEAGIDPGVRLWGLDTRRGSPIGGNLEAAGVDFTTVATVVDSPASGSVVGAYFLALGTFDAETLMASVQACEACVAPLTQTVAGKTTVLTWGPEPDATVLTARLARPFFDSLGRGGTFAATETTLLRTYSLDTARSGLDAIAGKGKRLNGVPGFADIARTLDDSNVIVATLGQTVPSELTRGEPTDPPLEPFVAYGVGIGLDSTGRVVITIVIAHANNRDASANRDALQERLMRGRSERLGKTWLEAFPQPTLNHGGKLVLLSLRPGPSFTGAARLALPVVALGLLATE